MSGSGWWPTPAPKYWKALTSAKSSWPMPAVRCTTATRSRPCSPKTSIERGYADGAQYLGMVDPESASSHRLLDHPAGARLGEFRQARRDAAAQRRYSGDLRCGIAIWRRAGRTGIAGHQDHRIRRVGGRRGAALIIVAHRHLFVTPLNDQ